jgi:hypothetical protein
MAEPNHHPPFLYQSGLAQIYLRWMLNARLSNKLLDQRSGKHPHKSRKTHLLQRIGHSLFLHMLERHASLATVTDVEEVLEQKILPDVSAFDYLITAWRDKQIFSLLKALAYQQSGMHYVSAAEIQRRAARSGLTMSLDELTAQLTALCREVRTVVERSPTSRTKFRLKVALLARHIQWMDRGANDLVIRPS